MRKIWIFLLVLLCAAAIAMVTLVATRGLRVQYDKSVTAMQNKTGPVPGLVTAADIRHLPKIVQKYLVVTGSVGKPRIRNMRIVWDGALRSDTQSPWMSAVMMQENFFQEYSRDFYLTAFMKGLPVSVWHSYHDQKATMQVKIISLIPIVDLKGRELTTTETVTLFNDMCLLAPGTLIDRRISWHEIDDRQVEATFTNGEYRINALLKFNSAGELVDFVSDDRSYLGPGNRLRRERWSTPVGEYREFEGRRVITRGEAIWHLPEGTYTYGKFLLKKIEYNVY